MVKDQLFDQPDQRLYETFEFNAEVVRVFDDSQSKLNRRASDRDRRQQGHPPGHIAKTSRVAGRRAGLVPQANRDHLR